MFVFSVFLVKNIASSQSLLSVNNPSPALPFEKGRGLNIAKYLLFLPLFILV